MAVDLWGPGGGQGPRGAVAPWSVKVQPRTWLSGGQPALRRGGSLEWSLCTGLGEGQPQAQRERPLPPGSAPSLWLQVADTGLWGACGPEDWAFPWLRCFSGPCPPC